MICHSKSVPYGKVIEDIYNNTLALILTEDSSPPTMTKDLRELIHVAGALIDLRSFVALWRDTITLSLEPINCTLLTVRYT